MFPSKAHGHSRRTEGCLCQGTDTRLGLWLWNWRAALVDFRKKVVISIDLKDGTPECGMSWPIYLPQFYSCSDRVSEAQKGDSSSSGIPEGGAPSPQARQAGLLLQNGDVGTIFSRLSRSPFLSLLQSHWPPYQSSKLPLSGLLTCPPDAPTPDTWMT